MTDFQQLLLRLNFSYYRKIDDYADVFAGTVDGKAVEILIDHQKGTGHIVEFD